MKQAFQTFNFRKEKLQVIQVAEQIITEYAKQGLTLTLRQLYYQFVTKNLIANSEREYKRLGEAVSQGRLAGMLDWDAIEDRVRVPRLPNEFADLKQLMESALAAYRLPRWATQSKYAELWVEKDALAGVLRPIAREYHVTLMVNRGYSSQSAMYEAGRRFAAQKRRSCYLFYLGDHDPSGEDMVRDVADRLEMFGAEVFVKKVALTMEQVRHYNPPPNPAKMTDSRAQAYVDKHGDESWEVDALPPEVLKTIIESELNLVLDRDLMNEIIRKEHRDKDSLEIAVDKIMKGLPL